MPCAASPSAQKGSRLDLIHAVPVVAPRGINRELVASSGLMAGIVKKISFLLDGIISPRPGCRL